MKPEMFAIAARCLQSAQGLEGPRRRMRERQAARFFWMGCGVLTAGSANPHLHAGPEESDVGVGRMRRVRRRIRPLPQPSGDKGPT